VESNIEMKNKKIVVKNINVADTIFSRMKGLMFCREMNGFDGLLISPCNSIHTFFMRMDIDVIFLDKKNFIVKIIRNMKPWRLTLIYFKSVKVLELKGGALPPNANEGDEIELCLN